MNYTKWYNVFDSFVQGNESKLTTIPTGRKHYFGECLPINHYFPVQKGVFEGIEVNLPGNIDAVLRNLYGNYMELPPVEMRERHYFVNFKI